MQNYSAGFLALANVQTQLRSLEDGLVDLMGMLEIVQWVSQNLVQVLYLQLLALNSQEGEKLFSSKHIVPNVAEQSISTSVRIARN